MGALTSKPYAFNARPWELKSFDSIDLSDSVGSNVRMDTRGAAVLRVLPRLNESLNEEWITDRTRFSYDGLSSQRLVVPLARISRETGFTKVSWARLLRELRRQLPVGELPIEVLVGRVSSFELLSFSKHLFGGASFLGESLHSLGDFDLQSAFLFNSSSDAFLKADMFLVLNVNLRFEAPSLNLKLKGSLRRNPGKKVFVAGASSSYSFGYPVVNLGDGFSFWASFFKGQHKLCRLFGISEFPLLIMGDRSPIEASSVVKLLNSSTNFRKLSSHESKWSGINFLSLDASTNSYKDLSLKGRPMLGSSDMGCNFVYSFGSDNVRFKSACTFAVYQGYNGDWGASNANLVIPTLHPYESSQSSYINVYGKPQLLSRAQFSEGDLPGDVDFLKYAAKSFNLALARGASKKPAPFSTLLSQFLFSGPWGTRSVDSYSWRVSSALNAMLMYSYIPFRRKRVKSYSSFKLGFKSPVVEERCYFNSYYSFSFYLVDATTRSSHIMALAHRRFRESTVFYSL